MNRKSNRIMIVVNAVSNLINFRHELIIALLQRGYEVLIVTPYGSGLSRYERMGCKVLIQSVNRHGKSVM